MQLKMCAGFSNTNEKRQRNQQKHFNLFYHIPKQQQSRKQEKTFKQKNFLDSCIKTPYLLELKSWL